MDLLDSVSHSVPWYYVGAAIFAGAGLLVYGVRTAFTRWEKDLGEPAWFDVAGEIGGIVLATVVGGLVGAVVWNPLLSAATAFVGAWSSNLVVGIIRTKFGATKEAIKDTLDSTDK